MRVPGFWACPALWDTDCGQFQVSTGLRKLVPGPDVLRPAPGELWAEASDARVVRDPQLSPSPRHRALLPEACHPAPCPLSVSLKRWGRKTSSYLWTPPWAWMGKLLPKVTRAQVAEQDKTLLSTILRADPDVPSGGRGMDTPWSPRVTLPRPGPQTGLHNLHGAYASGDLGSWQGWSAVSSHGVSLALGLGSASPNAPWLGSLPCRPPGPMTASTSVTKSSHTPARYSG